MKIDKRTNHRSRQDVVVLHGYAENIFAGAFLLLFPAFLASDDRSTFSTSCVHVSTSGRSSDRSATGTLGEDSSELIVGRYTLLLLMQLSFAESWVQRGRVGVPTCENAKQPHTNGLILQHGRPSS